MKKIALVLFAAAVSFYAGQSFAAKAKPVKVVKSSNVNSLQCKNSQVGRHSDSNGNLRRVANAKTKGQPGSSGVK
jgi:hypothetical protein